MAAVEFGAEEVRWRHGFPSGNGGAVHAKVTDQACCRVQGEGEIGDIGVDKIFMQAVWKPRVLHRAFSVDLDLPSL